MWPSRLIQLARWPVLAASIVVAVGLAGHGAAWTLAWLALRQPPESKAVHGQKATVALNRANP